MNRCLPLYLFFASVMIVGCAQPWEKEMASYDTRECRTYFTEREAKLSDIRNWLTDRTVGRAPESQSELIRIDQSDVDAMLVEFENIGYPFLGDLATSCRNSLSGSRLTFFRENRHAEFGPNELKEWGFLLGQHS